MHLQRLHRALGRVLAPERLDQPLGGHRLARMQEQHCEQRSLLGGAEFDFLAAPPDRQRAENAEFHESNVTLVTSELQTVFAENPC